MPARVAVAGGDDSGRTRGLLFDDYIETHLRDPLFIERIGLLPFTVYRLLLAGLIVWHFA